MHFSVSERAEDSSDDEEEKPVGLIGTMIESLFKRTTKQGIFQQIPFSLNSSFTAQKHNTSGVMHFELRNFCSFQPVSNCASHVFHFCFFLKERRENRTRTKNCT